MMETTLRRRWAALWGSCWLALAGCAREDTATQITMVVTSETKVPSELNALEVTVNRDDGSNVFYYLYPVASVSLFPATLAVVPRDEDSLRHSYSFEVRGILQAPDGSLRTAVLRRAVVGFARERNLLLAMPLRMACFAKDDCRADETCRGGSCVRSLLSADSLPSYDDRYVLGSWVPDACFDDDVCLAGGLITPVDSLCRFETAMIPVAVDAGGLDAGRPSFNVAIEWEAAPERDIVLDHGDVQEGWTVESDGMGRLAPGICQLLFAPPGTLNKANHLTVSNRCLAKQVLQPNCRGYAGHVKSPASTGDAGGDATAETAETFDATRLDSDVSEDTFATDVVTAFDSGAAP